MKLFFLFLFLGNLSYAQFHADNISKISSIDDAEQYAKRYREVNVGFVNAERDVFLFEELDSVNLGKHVGEQHLILNRETKFLKDTFQIIAHVQVIEFNDSLDADKTRELKDIIQKKLDSGASYWDIKFEFHASPLTFYSEPLSDDIILTKFNIDAHQASTQFSEWNNNSNGSFGFISVDEKPHRVPAFLAISYLRGS